MSLTRSSSTAAFLLAGTIRSLALLLTVGSCSGTRQPLVANPSPLSHVQRSLRAGFGRVDITPPPGAGLMGWGTEGYASQGHRQRLYARALVLEDKDGERFAFVGLDLGEVSVVLHRRVAQVLLDANTGLGADRIVLGATHTHAGPSHYFAQPAFDELGSDVSGFDVALTDSLVARIARAVRLAADTLREAKAAWGLDTLWGYTRIRSFAAYQRNGSSVRAALNSQFKPPGHLTPREAGVDATWGMLRIDVRDAVSQAYRPAGAMSIFAIHGTAMSSGIPLYDSDIHGLVSRRLEEMIDSGTSRTSPRGVHVFLNGGEGDVSPNYDLGTRCPTPMLVADRTARGPRTGSPRVTWQVVDRDRQRSTECEPLSISEQTRLANGIVQRAYRLYDSLEDKLSDTLTLDRAFRVIHLTKDELASSYFCSPNEGVTSFTGAEDGYTRLRWNWSLLGTDSVTYPPHPRAARAAGSRCHAAKRPAFGRLQWVLAGPRALPRDFQMSLVRVGSITLIAVPGEPTSNASWILRRAVATALGGVHSNADSVLTVGLANGYVHYLTTPAEYALQFYEGSATQFGPNSIVGMANLVRDMVPDLHESHARVLARPDTIFGYIRVRREITRWNAPPRTTGRATDVSQLTVRRWADSSQVSWVGTDPSQFYGATPTRLQFDERRDGAWHLVAWDNMPEINVYVSRRRDGQAAYRVRWAVDRSKYVSPLRFRVSTAMDARCWLIDDEHEMTC